MAWNSRLGIGNKQMKARIIKNILPTKKHFGICTVVSTALQQNLWSILQRSIFRSHTSSNKTKTSCETKKTNKRPSSKSPSMFPSSHWRPPSDLPHGGRSVLRSPGHHNPRCCEASSEARCFGPSQQRRSWNHLGASTLAFTTWGCIKTLVQNMEEIWDPYPLAILWCLSSYQVVDWSWKNCCMLWCSFSEGLASSQGLRFLWRGGGTSKLYTSTLKGGGV